MNYRHGGTSSLARSDPLSRQFIPSAARDLRYHNRKHTMQLARRTREAAPPEIPRFARNELSTWWHLLASKIRSPQPAVYPERSEGSPLSQPQTHHATSPSHARGCATGDSSLRSE